MKCKRILYFGLDPSRYVYEGELIHLPLIEIQPFPFEQVKAFFNVSHSHVLFTSRTAVTWFFHYTSKKDKCYIAIGKATAKRLNDFGITPTWIAAEPQGEGVIDLLEKIDYTHILYPHSAQARPLLPTYLQKRGTPFPLYETVPTEVTLPDLTTFDRFVFTSPSTVKAFQKKCADLPPKEKCEAIGPITQNALNNLFNSTILRT